jgi:hypothetical protein
LHIHFERFNFLTTLSQYFTLFNCILRFGSSCSLHRSAAKIVMFADLFFDFPDAPQSVWKDDAVSVAEGYGGSGVGIIRNGDPAFVDKARFGFGIFPFELADITGPDGPFFAGRLLGGSRFAYYNVFNRRHRSQIPFLRFIVRVP